MKVNNTDWFIFFNEDYEYANKLSDYGTLYYRSYNEDVKYNIKNKH